MDGIPQTASADPAKEDHFYKSSLSQVVEFLNTTLPPLPKAEETKEQIKDFPRRTARKLSKEPTQESNKVTRIAKPAPTREQPSLQFSRLYKIKDTKKMTKLQLKKEFGQIRDTKDTTPTRIRKDDSREQKRTHKRINKYTENIRNENIKKRNERIKVKKRLDRSTR